MNTPQHIGMGALSQEAHEGLNADAKRHCNHNNVPNWKWVPKIADFYDIKLMCSMFGNAVNWNAKEQLYENKKYLIYQKGVSDVNWKNAENCMSETGKIFLKDIDKIKCGDEELPERIQNQMNQGKSPLYDKVGQEIYQQLVFVNSSSNSTEEKQNMNQNFKHGGTKRSKKTYLKIIQSQSQSLSQMH